MNTEVDTPVVAEIPALPQTLISPRPFDLEAAKYRDAAIRVFCKEFLKPGEDFTALENFDRPALGKSGAEKLAIFCGLEPRMSSKDETLDWTGKDHGGEAFFYCLYRYSMYRDGILAGEGEGSCNSWEQKYRWRWIPEVALPSCFDKASLHVKRGVLFEYEFAIRKAETSGKYGKSAAHWQAFKDAAANGTGRRVEKNMRDNKTEWGVEIDTTYYRVPNPDNPDVVNTVQKIAQKRAMICAVIVATGVSYLFTQDVDDMPPELFGDRKPVAPKQEATVKPEARRNQEPQAQTRKADPPPVVPTPEAPSDAERMAKMELVFEDLRKRSGNTPWFRRRLGFAEVNSMTLDAGTALYKSMVQFVDEVRKIEAAKGLCDSAIYDRALFNAGIEDLWQATSLEVLQGIASALQGGVQ